MGSEDARLLVVRPDDHAIAVAHLPRVRGGRRNGDRRRGGLDHARVAAAGDRRGGVRRGVRARPRPPRRAEPGDVPHRRRRHGRADGRRRDRRLRRCSRRSRTAAAIRSDAAPRAADVHRAAVAHPVRASPARGRRRRAGDGAGCPDRWRQRRDRRLAPPTRGGVRPRPGADRRRRRRRPRAAPPPHPSRSHLRRGRCRRCEPRGRRSSTSARSAGRCRRRARGRRSRGSTRSCSAGTCSCASRPRGCCSRGATVPSWSTSRAAT